MWQGGEVKTRIEIEHGRFYATQHRVEYREGGTLIPIPCDNPRAKPRVAKAPKPGFGWRLHSLETNGRAKLEAMSESLTKGKSYVRVYYESQGGEQLYFDEGPMHANTAEARSRAYGSPSYGEKWSVTVYVEGEVPKGVGRKVVLPSQLPYEPERWKLAAAQPSLRLVVDNTIPPKLTDYLPPEAKAVVERAKKPRKSITKAEIREQIKVCDDLNVKEQKVFAAFGTDDPRSAVLTAATISELARLAFKNRPSVSKAQSWVRNSLRKLVKLGYVVKVDHGTYALKKAKAEAK